jgi:hypothetical protein
MFKRTGWANEPRDDGRSAAGAEMRVMMSDILQLVVAAMKAF